MGSSGCNRGRIVNLHNLHESSRLNAVKLSFRIIGFDEESKWSKGMYPAQVIEPGRSHGMQALMLRLKCQAFNTGVSVLRKTSRRDRCMSLASTGSSKLESVLLQKVQRHSSRRVSCPVGRIQSSISSVLHLSYYWELPERTRHPPQRSYAAGTSSFHFEYFFFISLWLALSRVVESRQCSKAMPGEEPCLLHYALR